MSLPAYTSPKQLQQKPMTTIKHKWAWEQRTGSSAAKLVLLALARRANEHLLAFPSVKSLSDDTELNRKTVLNCLSKLIELQLIIDTGYRVGSTKQVVVYKLQIDDNLNNTNLGTVIPETVPFLPDNSPVFTVEQSQKRATEELFNNKEKDNIPPIVPPSGDVSGSSPASQSHVEPAKTTEPDSKSAEPKPAKAKRTSAELTIEVPVSVNSTAWVEFVQHRKDIKKPLTEKACEKLFKLLAQFDAPTQQAMIDKSIESRWTGIFELKNRANQGFNSSASSWDKPLEITPEFAEHLQARFIAGQKRRGEI